MPPTYHGSCLCGEVKFEVTADPILVSCCHCKSCKKATGTVFTTNVIFPGGSTQITHGEDLVNTFLDTAQDSGNSLQRKFCGRCSSPLFNLGGDFKKTLAVFYSALDDFNVEDHDHKPPQLEFYTKDRTSWVKPFEGAEQAVTRPDRDNEGKP